MSSLRYLFVILSPSPLSVILSEAKDLLFNVSGAEPSSLRSSG